MATIKKILFFFSAAILLTGPKTALAFEVDYPAVFGLSVSDVSTFGQYICYIYGLVMAAGLFIAVSATAYGGIYFIISYGRGKFTTEAQAWMKAGLTGLLIVAGASLIANTINPRLTACQLAALPIINNFVSLPENFLTPGADIKTYKEIPAGTLTENLLTRTISCYGFDPQGDPIWSDEIKPTYLEHDRADCLSQLIEGAQKKANVIAGLSDEIIKLMDDCKCDETKCSAQTNNFCADPKNNKCFNGNQENGKKDSCKAAANTDGECCGKDVKNKIEHGPVKAGGKDAGFAEKEFKGLDEFRCPVQGLAFQQCAGIAGLVESAIQIDKKNVVVVNKEKWNKLNLYQQLTYFKEKINSFATESKLRADLDSLQQASSLIDSTDCYMAKSYVDVLKEYEQTDQWTGAIVARKIFSDPATGGKISPIKYCEGFGYANSSCFKKCNDECPDSSPQALQSYKECGGCNNNNAECLVKQQECIKNKYASRPCVKNGESQDFTDCLISCRDNCAQLCSERYQDGSAEYKICRNQCLDNSECILNNAGSCLLNPLAFFGCANSATDAGNAQYCIDNAYKCKNGSDEYSGYGDCLDPKKNAAAIAENENSCSQDKFSSSFLFDHPQCQKCPKPNDIPEQGTTCYNSAIKNQPGYNASCQDACPETSKCPAASACPACPCDQLQINNKDNNVKYEFLVPNESTRQNAGKEGVSPINPPLKISAFRMTGPQCTGYSYNDDPLTFYCQDSWWRDPNNKNQNEVPLGNSFKCKKSDEIPIGQAIDESKNWANNLIGTASQTADRLQSLLKKMWKIGKARDTEPVKNYCKCNAKFENKTPICMADCKYIPPKKIGVDQNTGEPIFSEPECEKGSCKGKPCQQMIDYFSQLLNDYRQFRIYYLDFYASFAQEPRSDILKKLSYARQGINYCSSINSIEKEEVRLFSCTKAEKEQMPDIVPSSASAEALDYYCYGEKLGQIKNIDLTDNWFCCEKYSNN